MDDKIKAYVKNNIRKTANAFGALTKAQPSIVSPLPQKQTLSKPSLGQQLRTGTANPLLQGIFNLPESMKITAQRIPGAINTMVMNPQQAGNLARTAPQYSQMKVPFLQGAANFSANYGQTFGQGLQNMAMGVDSIKNKKTAFGKVQGGATLLKGAGQTMVPFTVGSGLPFLATNLITSSPQSKIPFLDNLQRFSAGVQRGLAQDSTLSPNIKAKNTINFNIGDNKISFDPVMGVGEMLGFVKNPVNANLFKMTEKVFPAGQLFNKNTNLIKWLSVTPLRGSVENILIDLAKVPENASREEKIKFMLGTAAMGAVSEVVGRGGMDAVSGAVNSKVGRASQKYLADAFDELKNVYRLANVPVATNRWNNGERVVEPLWRAKVGQGMEFARKNEGFINIGAKVGKNDVAQPPLYDTALPGNNVAYHFTDTNSANLINKEGFKSGSQLGVREKRAGIFAFPEQTNPRFTRPYDSGGKVKLDLSNLKIENRLAKDYTTEQLARHENTIIPAGTDGVITKYGNGANEIVLTPEAANKARSQPPVTDMMGKIKSTLKDQRGFIRIGAEVGGGSQIKRPELRGKLSGEDALIQAGLDSGWSSLLKSGQTDINKLTASERDYLLKSATSYFLSGDPVIKKRVKFYGEVGGKESGQQLLEQGVKSSSQPIIPQGFTATNQLTKNKVKLRNFDAEGRSARQDYEEWSRAVKQQEAPRTTTGAMNTATKAMKTNTVSPAARDVSGYKDISGFSGQARDVYRNFKQVFGNKYADVKRTVLDPFDSSKGKFTRNLYNWAEQLDTNIVKKYGFNKGSRESAAIQQYGEGTKDFRQLVEEFGDAKAKNIVEADKWFRQQYDSLLGEVNAIRAKIYPNDPEKIIPRRSDYYRHFKEMQEGFSGLVNIFDTPANIQSGLSGISANTKPKAKWLSFAQKRLGGESDIDAVGGFINYVKAAEYAKNIDPHISRFRALREELAQATDIGTPQAGKLNNFLEFLDNYANDLSGKTSTADRFIQTVIPGGRKTMSVINWANNRVKANVILGNASSSMAQIMNVPNGVANAGPIASTKGLGRTVASIFDDNKVIKQSDFIAERYSGGTFNRFDRGMVKNTKKMAAWMIQVLDEVGTKYIWNSHYEKALSEGVPNPVKYADDFTREMVAGRGIGEVPLIQKSKVFQLVAPFQLEVGNLWHVMGDMVGEKQFGKLATLFVSSYILNRGIEKVRGSDVSFDPINASIEAYQTYMEEEDKGKAAVQAGGRLAGEVLSNIPFGQSVAAMYPEYGFKVGESQAPTREDLFGKGDPTRYGSGLLLTKGVQDPLFKLLPPFGGQQLKRTIEGIKSVWQGYAESASGKVQYPIEKNVRNFLQAGIFGKYSIPEAQDYFNENRSVLGDKQSETFKNAQDPNAVYDKVMADRASKKDTSSSTINFEDEAKLRLEEGSGVAYAPGKIYYKDINGDVKSINTGSVTGLSEDNKYLKAIKNSKAFTIADDIIESNLPDEVKNQALSDIGIDREDAEYYSIASQSNDLKSIYLLEVAQAFVNNSGNRQDMIDVLVSQRRKVNGDMIASDGVLDNLYNDGYITNEERKALKDIDFDAEGKLKVKPSSGGKKLKAVKAPTYKLSRKARQKLRKPKLASIKLEGSKKLKTTKPKKFAPIKLVNSKK